MKILIYGTHFPLPQDLGHQAFMLNYLKSAKSMADSVFVIKMVSFVIPERVFYGKKKKEIFKDWKRKLVSPRKVKIEDTDVYYIPFYYLPKRLFLFLEGLFCFVFSFGLIFLKRNDFDTIWAHSITTSGIAGFLAAKILGKKIVLHSHGVDANTYSKGSITRHIVKYVIEHSDRTIVVSKGLLEEYKKINVNSERIQILPNSFDPRLFNNFGDKNKIITDWKIKNKLKYIFIFVGQFVDRKDPKGIISAFKCLKKDIVDVGLVMVGEGILENELKKMSDPSVLFIGQINPAEVAGCMRACDFLVNFSHAEGWPTIFYEAMACGLPVICSNIPGNNEIVENNINGLLCEEYNIESLKDKMKLSLSIKWNLEKILEIADKNSLKSFNRKIAEIFKSL